MYARVSSDEQFEKGNSIPDQLERCVTYTSHIGGEVVESITDDVSGTLIDRPGLHRVREILRAHRADGIVVFRSDRLTRELGHFLILRDEFRQLGSEIHFVNHGKVEDTPEGKMFGNIEATFNDYWRQKLIEDTSRGRNQKAKNGKFVGVGSAPYGLQYDPRSDTISLNKDEAWVVEIIFRWYVIGDESGKRLTMRRIAIRLSQDKVPTPKYYGKRLRQDGVWNVTCISTILQNETYCGVWHWNKTVRGTTTGRTGQVHHIQQRQPRDQWIGVTVPPIIDRATYDKAQLIRKSNIDQSPRNTKNFYLLRLMITCNRCNRHFFGYTSHTRLKGGIRKAYRYYHCATNHANMGPLENMCPSPNLKAEYIEGLVWNNINAILTDDALFEQGIAEAIRIQGSQQQPVHDRILIIDKLLGQADEELMSLTAAIRAVKVGSRAHAKLTADVTQLDLEFERLGAERTDLQAKLNHTISTEQIEAVRDARRKAKVGLQNPTEDDKRRTLEGILAQVTVGYDNVAGKDVITLSCTLSPKPILLVG